MAGRDDRDKTVIGGQATGPGGPGGAARPDPFGRRQGAPAGESRERTVIGGAAQGPVSGSGAGIGGRRQDTDGNTWVGGPLPGQGAPGGAAQGGRGFGTGVGSGVGAGIGPGTGAGIGRPAGRAGDGFFPDMAPRDRPIERVEAARIPLSEALRGTGLGAAGGSNPLVGAAADLLILFGRLRTGLVEMQARPLMEHVYHEIIAFEGNAQGAGVPHHIVEVAKYALCGTADDIVQNLPAADRGQWSEYSMAARFFNTRDTGVGFFHEAEKAMQAPGEYYDLLELMLTCLSLGFEGEYRTRPNGSTELARIRQAIHTALRTQRPRPDDDISPTWVPVILRGKRRFGGVPVWAFAGIAALLVVGFFATLSTLLNREGAAVANALYTMHPTEVGVSLERTVPVVPFIAPTTQLDRITAALAPEIAAGQVAVEQRGNYIFVTVGNLLLFDTGAAEVKPEFAPVAARIAEVLNNEPGPVMVHGFTDSRGSAPNNLALSVARAQGVADMLSPQIDDPGRLLVEGRGEADPIGDNETEEGRALNRRVVVLIAREGTF